MAYDAAGNVVAVTDANNNTTSFTYDGLSRQLTETKPLGQTLTYVYDSRDRLDYRLNARGHRIDYSYAPWGPVTREEVYNPDNTTGVPDETITYAYDLNGNLTETAYDAVQPLNEPLYTITYDPLDRENVRTVGYIPNLTVTLDNDYDRYGNRSRLIVDDGELLVHDYDYDRLDRVAQVTLPGNQVFTLEYYANDDRKTINYPNGVTTEYVYRPNGPIQSISIRKSTGAVIEQFAYTYDEVLNVSSLTDGDGTHVYRYDGLDRIVQASHPPAYGTASLENFLYDRVGNRKDALAPDDWVYDKNNRLSNANGVYYRFDTDGNLQSAQGEVWTANAFNRFSEFALSGLVAEYVYEPNGRRLAKALGSDSQYYLWDGDVVVAEYIGDGSQTRRHQYAPGEFSPIATSGATDSFYHSDAVGSSRFLTSAVGEEVTWRARYSSYGVAEIDDDIDGNGQAVFCPFRFPGQYQDVESSYYYNLHRFYDPRLGRYVQADPAGFATGQYNLYLYASGNPLVWIDPLGLVVAKPGFWEGMIPVWGSGKQAINDFQCGRWGWGLVNSALAVSDVFLVKAIATGVAKGLGKGALKMGMSRPNPAFPRGIEWVERAHFVPNRWIPDSLKGVGWSKWNTKLMWGSDHALADPKRYQFMRRWWKANNPMPHGVSRFFNSIPERLQVLGLGSVYGAGRAANTSRDPDCGCE
jgi:RHS repeat-associated protein